MNFARCGHPVSTTHSSGEKSGATQNNTAIRIGFNVPLVVRLEGTEVEQGRKILAESGVDIIAAKDLTDAANKVVKAAS